MSQSEPVQISFAGELARKSTHMAALMIPSSYYLFNLSKSEMLLIWGIAAALVITVDLSRLRNWKLWKYLDWKIFSKMIRPHEVRGGFTGATYILTAVCLTVALFDKPIAVAALCFIIVGDSLAALVGRKWGRHRFGNKSFEGSAACLAGTLVVAYLVPGIAMAVGITGAVIATVVEAQPWPIDDNLSVPIISGLAMSLMSKFLV